MVCPVCDAEVCDAEVCDAEVCDPEAASCQECETPLARWNARDFEFHARPRVQCGRCGECPSPGDRACRQCQAHFLERTPDWLDAEFPGWFQSVGGDPVPIFHCISCGLKVVLGGVQCEICGLQFHRPTEFSLLAYEPGIGEVTLGLEPDEEGSAVAPCVHAELGGVIVSRAQAIIGITLNNNHANVRDAKQENSSAPAAVTPPACAAPLAPATAQPIISPVRDLAPKTRSGEGITAAVIAAHVIPPRARLLTERQTSYTALISSGKIRPVPSVKSLSGQSVVCAHGHRSNFGLFACLPGYGTLDNLPENDSRSHNWLGSALHRRGGVALHNINDRDPSHDVRWQLGCPRCGTDLYTFEAEALREYVMCTASPDLFWVFCHLYRRHLGTCGNCEIRGVYWNALRSLE